MKFRNYLLTGLLFYITTISIFGQAKKPTLMILPSDNWCEMRYFMQEFNNQGVKQKVPNYKQAFQEDTEIGQVISKIGALMIDRGFPVKDVEQELKAIESRTGEENITTSFTTGSFLAESPLDKLIRKSKADILIQIWWKVTKTNEGKVVSFVLEAFDSYTSKRIASASGNSKPNSTDIVPVLLESAIKANIKPFNTQLQVYFDNMSKNGREIILTIRRWNNWDNNLESEVDGEEITDHINKWLKRNTINKMYNMSDATENQIRFEQVRIPLYNSDNEPIDAREFAKGLQKFLKSEPFNFQVKLMTRGLGEAILVLGEK